MREGTLSWQTASAMTASTQNFNGGGFEKDLALAETTIGTMGFQAATTGIHTQKAMTMFTQAWATNGGA